MRSKEKFWNVHDVAFSSQPWRDFKPRGFSRYMEGFRSSSVFPIQDSFPRPDAVQFTCNYLNVFDGEKWQSRLLGVIQLAFHDSQLPVRNAGINQNDYDAEKCDYEHRQIVGLPPLIAGFFILGAAWFLLWGRGFSIQWWRMAFGLPLCMVGAFGFVWGISHVLPALAPTDCRSEAVPVRAAIVAELM
jgi:hypothetical protein